MEASIATCSTSPSGTVTEKAALESHWNLAAAKLMKEPGALDSLVKSLSQEDDLNLQELAAKTLRNLAAAEDHGIKVQILNGEGALKGLVKLLPTGDSEVRDVVRKIAVQTLGYLAAADENCVKIISDEGAREGLVECLFDFNSALQEQAAWALKELARGSPEPIVEDGRAVLGLLKALSYHHRPGLQEHALTFLLLASEQLVYEVTEKVIVDDDGYALGNLVECLSAIENPGLQKLAFRVLMGILNNCCYQDTVTQILIEKEKFLVRGLVSCLSVTDDHDLQEGVVEVLFNLWENYDSIKERITYEPDAITGLVTCMSATHKPSLQLRANLALVKLARYNFDDSVQIVAQIAEEKGAVAGFVKCLSANCDLQKESAAAALAILTEVKDPKVKRRVIDEDGAISGLVKCSSSSSPCLKREAIRALANITKGSGTCYKRRKIVHTGYGRRGTSRVKLENEEVL